MTIDSSDNAKLRVICYAGYRGEEEPRTFFIGQRALDVVQIVDRWTG